MSSKKEINATKKYINVKGAREHNLKNIDVSIPKDSITVITGLSGSGKSSLAFDTIYAEGQRRYVESLSAYARQPLGGPLGGFLGALWGLWGVSWGFLGGLLGVSWGSFEGFLKAF